MLLTGISLIIQNTFCMTQPIIINLLSNEQSQELHFYPSEANQDKCARICNTFDALSKKVYFPNETEDSKLLVFNMASGIIESRTLTKHISCKCECKFDGRKNNLNQKWNNNNFWCKSKKLEEYRVCQKFIFGILQCVTVKMVNMQEVLWLIQLLRVIKLQQKQKIFQQKVLQRKLFY